jgi:glutaredoxin 3
MTRSFLEANNIPFTDIDIAADKEARKDMISRSKQLSVPAIDIDGEFVIGFDEARLREKLGLN